MDVNTDIYPMEVDAHYAMVLASSLNQDDKEDFDIFTYLNEGKGKSQSSLLDDYDYVVHGKVFKQSINKEKM